MGLKSTVADRYGGAAQPDRTRKGCHSRVRLIAITTLSFVLLAGGASGRDIVRRSATVGVPRVPSAIVSLLETAVRAINVHRVDALAPLTSVDPKETFAWAATKSRDWKAEALAAPGAPDREPVYLAVFHAWHTCESDGDHVYKLVHAASGGNDEWRLGGEIPETETLGLRIRDHSIEAKIDVDRKTAAFKDNVTIERTVPSQNSSASGAFALLRISEDYSVRTLHLAGNDQNLPFRQVGGIVAFVPPPSAKFILSLEYAGRLDHHNGDFIHEDEAVIASYWYPHIARLPATLTLTVTPPPGWTALGQGEPVASRTESNGAETITWRNEVPVSYFTLDAGRYHITTRRWQGRILSAYLLDDTETGARLAKHSLDLLQDSLAFYEKAFGPFPFRRYAVVQTHGPFSGALEAYSFATFGPRTLPDYIPHELSHTWWGGLLPCTYTHSMWNEAFANYSDDLYRRVSASRAAEANQAATVIDQRLNARKRDADAYASTAVAEAADTDDERQSAVGYGKGAQVLRVLEDEIGQEAMMRSMRAFITGHVRSEAAEWPEFEKAIRRETGTDMRWFFAQWLERQGNPRIAVDSLNLQAAGRDSYVEGRIVQTNPPYRMKLTIMVDLRSGGQIQQTIDVNAAETPFRIRVPGMPDRLRIDPDAIFPLSAASGGNGKDDPFTYTFP